MAPSRNYILITIFRIVFQSFSIKKSSKVVKFFSYSSSISSLTLHVVVVSLNVCASHLFGVI
jgi:hypothetical protein